MTALKQSQRARVAVREFKTITESLALRGFYQPSGRFGKTLEGCLKDLSPEIYETINDNRVVDLKGLEYVIDRLPRGIEQARKVILTDEDAFEDTPFERIQPLKRRRVSYRISDRELCLIVSRGISEIYDIITHITFLGIEAKKIYYKMHDDHGNIRLEWENLEKVVGKTGHLSPGDLDSALWNLSIILGRSYHDTRESFESMEQGRIQHQSNDGLFSLIYHLGSSIDNEKHSRDHTRVVYFAPSLMNIIGHQKYGKIWAGAIKEKLVEAGLQDRPIHVISANMHSVINTLYGYGAVAAECPEKMENGDFCSFITGIREDSDRVRSYAAERGMIHIPDGSGANIDCQIIDTGRLEGVPMHPELELLPDCFSVAKPVLLVMDYAFGVQAFELMEQLLKPLSVDSKEIPMQIGSISIMGKAGILVGDKGDIMLATAHVLEGTSDNYLVNNDLAEADFGSGHKVFTGPMATVLGTSLQNKDILEMFLADWKTVGLEMEGGHYQKAINASIIKGNIPPDTRTRYAYYASDNPLMTGNTLAAGAMGVEGIRPTYAITRVILEKIFSHCSNPSSLN